MCHLISCRLFEGSDADLVGGDRVYTEGERIICIPRDFLFLYSKQTPKYTNLLISIAELSEFTLTHSVIKEDKKIPFRNGH